MDDNEEIIRRLGTLSKSPPIVEIQARLDIGKSRYKHGVRAHDDTTQWGTKTNSWLEMALEEIDDAIIYVLAESIREHGVVCLPKYGRVTSNLLEIRKQVVELQEDREGE